MKTSQRTRRVFEPQQKITAVLSIWSERRTSAQVCQEMDISPTLLGQWQNLAIEGMLKALDPTKKDPLAADQSAVVAADRKEAERTRQAGEASPIKTSRRQRRPDSRGRLWPSNHRAARRRGSEPR
jgi:transposase-like protein